MILCHTLIPLVLASYSYLNHSMCIPIIHLQYSGAIQCDATAKSSVLWFSRRARVVLAARGFQKLPCLCVTRATLFAAPDSGCSQGAWWSLGTLWSRSIRETEALTPAAQRFTHDCVCWHNEVWLHDAHMCAQTCCTSVGENKKDEMDFPYPIIFWLLLWICGKLVRIIFRAIIFLEKFKHLSDKPESDTLLSWARFCVTWRAYHSFTFASDEDVACIRPSCTGMLCQQHSLGRGRKKCPLRIFSPDLFFWSVHVSSLKGDLLNLNRNHG